jgi:hypothetical protein
MLMKKNLLPLLSLSLALSLMASCSPKVEPSSATLAPRKEAHIDSLAQRYLQLQRFSGSILIAQEEGIGYHKYFGLADYENQIPFKTNTAFKVGEITRLFTDILWQRHFEAGAYHLKDSLPAAAQEFGLKHTWASFLQPDANIDYGLKGRLLESISGQTYEALLEELSHDLQLENTALAEGPNLARGYLYHNYRGQGLELQEAPTYSPELAFSDYGIQSTPLDLLKVLEAYPQEFQKAGYLDNDGFSFALKHDPQTKNSLIVLSNRRHPVAQEILQSLEAILNEAEYQLPLLREPYAIESATLADFVGGYSLNENVKFSVYVSKKSLWLEMGSMNIELIPQSDHQFYMPDIDAALRFERDSLGQVQQVQLLDGFLDSDQIAYREK